jgi:hypothetical protein
MGSPVIFPSLPSSGLLFDAKVVFERRFMQMATRPDYTSFLGVCQKDNPAGDRIIVIIDNPIGPMPEFTGTRHKAETNFDYWEQNVRTFASGMAFDVWDALPDSGTPLKAMMYMAAQERLGESAALLYPAIFNQAITTGLTKLWKPDGLPFWGLHYIDPRRPSLGSNRNYFSKSAQGGSAALPITYGNVLKVLKNGLAWHVPGGDAGQQRAVMYNAWRTAPENVPLLRRLLSADLLPAWEVNGQDATTTNSGGMVPNEIRNFWGGATHDVQGVANMSTKLWLGFDTSSPADTTFRVKERLPVIWQRIDAVLGATGAGPNAIDISALTGIVSEQVYRTFTTEYGPVARGEVYMANVHGAVLCDSTP